MSLVTRVQNILLRPQAEWPVIAAEPATPASILVGYVVPLAAIGPIAAFIGTSIVGVGIPFIGTYRVPFAAGIVNAVLSYVFALIGVFLIAGIVYALAPSFGAAKSWIGALKVTAYSLTPCFIAGILSILPVLGILAFLAGFYGIYLLFIGLPIVMGSSKERAPLYTLSVVGCAIVVGCIFGVASFAVRGVSYAMTGAPSFLSSTTVDTTSAQNAAAAIVANSGGNPADQQAAKDTVNAVASAAAQADEANKSGDAGSQAAAGMGMLKALVSGGKQNVAVIPRDQLTSLLPTSLGDMTRGDAQGESGSFAGVKGSKAAASYKDPSGTLQIEVSDLGNAGGLAMLAGSAANLVEEENDEGYERNVDVGGGQKVHESWKNATKHSELFEIVDSRFAVGVTGDGVDMDTALKALQSIDVGKLRDMAAAAK
jgi:hypothetical protein